jgi:hypothetical protein
VVLRKKRERERKGRERQRKRERERGKMHVQVVCDSITVEHDRLGDV